MHLDYWAAPLACADPLGAGLSSVQYMPRVCGYEPPAVRQPPSLPVLLYREFLELPELRPDTIATIREVLAQQARTEQVCGLPPTCLQPANRANNPTASPPPFLNSTITGQAGAPGGPRAYKHGTH